MMWFANVNSLNEDIMACVDVLVDADVDTLHGEIVECASVMF
jgi:hypothetical protein